MNQKAYSVLFCALLASTFVHELRAKGVAPPVSSRLEAFERAASVEVCELDCSFNVNITESFGLTIQVVENILVIAKESANVAFLLDVSANIVVVLNGTSGAGVAIDLSAKTGVYLKSGLWVAAKGSLEVYIKSLSGGLKAIFSISGAVKFSLASASSAILEVINQIIVNLVAGISEEIKQNEKLGLIILISVSVELVGLLNGVLKGLLGVFAAGALQISFTLTGLLNALQGFAVIIKAVGGNLVALIEKGLKLNLKLILSASTGLEVLINILLQLGAVIDVAVLGSILNNAESLFKLIAQLGGNASVGVNGLFGVLANIVGLINKNVTLEVAISVIIQFVALSSQTSPDLTQEFQALLEGFLTVVAHLNLGGSLKGLVSILEGLLKGNLVIGGVNISAIVAKLLTGAIKGCATLLEVVVYVVIQLEAAVAIATLIPYLALVLIFKLNSAIGVRQLIALGIKIDLSASAIANGILKSFLSGSYGIIIGIATGNFYDALIQLPAIGVLLQALNTALVAASGGKLSLKASLNVSTLVRSWILGLIQFATGFYLGISSSGINQVKSLLETSGGASAFLHIDFSASVSYGFSSS